MGKSVSPPSTGSAELMCEYLLIELIDSNKLNATGQSFPTVFKVSHEEHLEWAVTRGDKVSLQE